METWIVLEKFDRPDRGDHQLVLKVERNGRVREAVVSGQTWLAAEVGKPVELLPEVRR
jgi:hypothetical protein